MSFVGFFKYRKMLENGSIRRREAGFEKNARSFILHGCTPGMVLRELAKIPFSDMGVLCEKKENEFLFTFTAKEWTAALVPRYQYGDLLRFEFRFQSWMAFGSTPKDITYMNMTLTAVEKAFETLDPYLEVSDIPMTYDKGHLSDRP